MDQRTMASINLNAILRTMARLPQVDAESAGIASRGACTIQFAASGVTTVRLAVGEPRTSWSAGAGPSQIKLWFPTPGMVNRMFSGAGMPIPVAGFRRLNYLTGDFTALSRRLERLLQPDADELRDAGIRAANADLTFHLAIYALAEIGNCDPVGVTNARRIPDGEIQVAVREGGPALVLAARSGRLHVRPGRSSQWRAKMVFADLEAAGQVLRGETAAYTAIGRQQIELGGYVPMLDNMNKLLGLVPRYLG